MTTDLYLIRHGQTRWNLAGRFQGHLDSPLTHLGQSQAKASGQWLAALPQPPTALYTSDLGRAAETARLLQSAFSTTPPTLHIEPRLRERHMGVLQGTTHDEGKLHHPEAYAAYRNPNPDMRIPGGGESLRDTQKRVVACLKALVQQHPNGTLALISHGGTLTLVFRHIIGLSLDAPRHFDVPNASIHHIRHHNDSFRLVLWGLTTHLG